MFEVGGDQLEGAWDGMVYGWTVGGNYSQMATERVVEARAGQ